MSTRLSSKQICLTSNLLIQLDKLWSAVQRDLNPSRHILSIRIENEKPRCFQTQRQRYLAYPKYADTGWLPVRQLKRAWTEPVYFSLCLTLSTRAQSHLRLLSCAAPSLKVAAVWSFAWTNSLRRLLKQRAKLIIYENRCRGGQLREPFNEFTVLLMLSATFPQHFRLQALCAI